MINTERIIQVELWGLFQVYYEKRSDLNTDNYKDLCEYGLVCIDPENKRWDVTEEGMMVMKAALKGANTLIEQERS